MWRNGANGASLSPNALTGRKRDFLLRSLDINEKRICHITRTYHEPMQKRCTAQVPSFDTHEHVIGLLIQSLVSYTDFSPEDGGSLFFLYVGTTNKSTQHSNPEHYHQHSHRRKNIKSQCLPIYARDSEMVSFDVVFWQRFFCFPVSYYMYCLLQLIFDNSNIFTWSIQIMNLPSMKYLFPCYFISHRSRYSTQHQGFTLSLNSQRARNQVCLI
jgi:hypothetical protein